jgi:hypothetical protein
MTNHCTYEQSQALKEIGFDLPVRDCYDIDHHLCCNNHTWNWNLTPHFTSAPTHAEALEWFREKKGIDGWAQPKLNDDTGKKRYVYYIFQSRYYGQSAVTYPTHHEATSALIDKIIEITKTAGK